MSRRLIRGLVVLSVLAIVGVVAVQVAWLRRAQSLAERQFRQSAFIALQDVAERVAALNRAQPGRQAVTQLSADYYVVNTNAPIDPASLEVFIQDALRQHRLVSDFEYGIYDCTSDRMVYGAYVPISNRQPGKLALGRALPGKSLPRFSRYTYYFGIRFPGAATGGLGPDWIASSVAVGLVVLLFGYTLVIVLRQRRLAEVQQAFVQNITHELQTPVATLRIAANVVEQLANETATSSGGQRLRQYARVVQQETARLQTHVQRVLDAARVGQSNVALKREPVNLHHILQRAAETHAPYVALDLRATRPVVLADVYHLETALANLIDNALKYVADEPHVTLSTEDRGRGMVWAIEDNGVGIAPKHQRAVFRQFWRVDDRKPGFGLGLYYVRQVVRAHGWRLALRSEPDRGSRFTITVSQAQPADVAPKPLRSENTVVNGL